ncbi:MAG: cell wall-binding repeat-containing protein [Microbacteriaceae bacterium]
MNSSILSSSPRSARVRLLVVAVVVALGLGAAVVPAQPASAATSAETAIQRILADTNKHRAANGKPALQRNASMEKVAMNWSAQQFKNGEMSHNPKYSQQIPAGWRGAAENVAYGYTHTAVVGAWIKSAGHNRNLLGDYTDIGIGYYEKNGERYFTQVFARYPASTTAPPPVSAPKDISVDRIGGADRYTVSASTSASTYKPGVPVVYIAAGGNFPDALSAGAAAARLGGPLLLVEKTRIPAPVAAELQRLKPGRIIVAGGPGSVSNGVVNVLGRYSTKVDRDGGADRYDVSRAVTARAFSAGASTVYVADGRGFADALSANSAASRTDSPVVMLPGNAKRLDSATTSLLRKLGAKKVVIVGGPASVRPELATALNAVPGVDSVTRFGGADRFAVSSAINRDTFSAAARVYVASGTTFPDALSGGPVASAHDAPLYVIPKTCIPSALAQDLKRLGTKKVTVLGGPGSVAPAIASLPTCR